jgi:hypothetical protein
VPCTKWPADCEPHLDGVGAACGGRQLEKTQLKPRAQQLGLEPNDFVHKHVHRPAGLGLDASDKIDLNLSYIMYSPMHPGPNSMWLWVHKCIEYLANLTVCVNHFCCLRSDPVLLMLQILTNTRLPKCNIVVNMNKHPGRAASLFKCTSWTKTEMCNCHACGDAGESCVM